jgi:uncharacterized membrane protein
VALVLARIFWTGQLRFGFLIWNLFLAWVPLVLALLACENFQREPERHWRFLGLSCAWLLFFPNAPYIFTDLIHVFSRDSAHFWMDLTLILVCALTGLVLGFVSLYLMQSLAARMFGRVASWLFVAGAAGMSSIGVYLGRFLRFNSWDLLLRPVKVCRRLDAWLDAPRTDTTALGFVVLFAIFLFLAYMLLYALTHLSPVRSIVERQEPHFTT